MIVVVKPLVPKQLEIPLLRAVHRPLGLHHLDLPAVLRHQVLPQDRVHALLQIQAVVPGGVGPAEIVELPGLLHVLRDVFFVKDHGEHADGELAVGDEVEDGRGVAGPVHEELHGGGGGGGAGGHDPAELGGGDLEIHCQCLQQQLLRVVLRLHRLEAPQPPVELLRGQRPALLAHQLRLVGRLVLHGVGEPVRGGEGQGAGLGEGPIVLRVLGGGVGLAVQEEPAGEAIGEGGVVLLLEHLPSPEALVRDPPAERVLQIQRVRPTRIQERKIRGLRRRRHPPQAAPHDLQLRHPPAERVPVQVQQPHQSPDPPEAQAVARQQHGLDVEVDHQGVREDEGGLVGAPAGPDVHEPEGGDAAEELGEGVHGGEGESGLDLAAGGVGGGAHGAEEGGVVRSLTSPGVVGQPDLLHAIRGHQHLPQTQERLVHKVVEG
mmetsp:Transcript_59712/g.159787  ORF Transcript_59712/g.159787 Transcript_59712/m.159787 type:complete len:434 (-) Transcript_59712:511-1812(-)